MAKYKRINAILVDDNDKWDCRCLAEYFFFKEDKENPSIFVNGNTMLFVKAKRKCVNGKFKFSEHIYLYKLSVYNEWKLLVDTLDMNCMANILNTFGFVYSMNNNLFYEEMISNYEYTFGGDFNV